jgi:hypothetical protein
MRVHANRRGLTDLQKCSGRFFTIVDWLSPQHARLPITRRDEQELQHNFSGCIIAVRPVASISDNIVEMSRALSNVSARRPAFSPLKQPSICCQHTRVRAQRASGESNPFADGQKRAKQFAKGCAKSLRAGVKRSADTVSARYGFDPALYA